jgi:pyruvate dehydrogenase kinase 2/3/4
VLVDQSLFVDRDERDECDGRPRREVPGVVSEAVELRSLAQDAAEIARELCERALGDAPEVAFSPTEPCLPPPHVTSVPGIPHLFHAALLEVFKNAARASTLRARALGGSDSPPAPLAVRVVPSDEDVAVVIDDIGGGIARREVDRLLFGYCRSTAKPPLDEDDPCARVLGVNDADPDASRAASPLAGFGVGIPYARAQLRLFGGDLRALSVAGLGTRVVCFFPRDALSVREDIPLYP